MLSLSLALVALQDWSPPTHSKVLEANDCSNSDLGPDVVPLTDLGPGAYLGFEGGLYPGGRNHRPKAHDDAGITLAKAIEPLLPDGTPDPGGRIGFLSVGMSNARIQFGLFRKLAVADPDVNPRLVLVNGAQPGWGAEEMVDPNASYWAQTDQYVADAGLTPLQIQVLWVLVENIEVTGPFPRKARTLGDQTAQILNIARGKFPNATIAFGSSRTYGGYTKLPYGTEPVAYENGFAMKWTIERQIEGDPQLNHDPAQGPVLAPWFAWGPYTWANGLRPRSDGLTFACDDFRSDGLHPLGTGVLKLAQEHLHFFRSDAAARPWFLQSPTPTSGFQAQVQPYGEGFGGPNGGARLAVSTLPRVPSSKPLVVHGSRAPSGMPGYFSMGAHALPVGQVPLFFGWQLTTAEQGQVRLTDEFGQATWKLGTIPDDPALWGVEIYLQYVVKDFSGVDVTRGLRLRFGH